MTNAVKDAVERIKGAGFDHIKVELEGDIGRDGDRDCADCYGEGQIDCDSCGGEGAVDTEDRVGVGNLVVWQECEDCYGEGRHDCMNCDGRGTSGDYRDVDVCEDFMLNYVPSDVRNRLVYSKFYEDGSVDSEFTFTIHIDHVEDVNHWINAFKALSEDCGNSEVDVSGAGLHITVIPNSAGGRYPCQDYGLNPTNVGNFIENVNKLMPALFFLASADHKSRGISYRYPLVARDKYDCPQSAVGVCTHNDSCIEYRVFETCYDRPEAFGDYIQVIANTLKFYSDPSLKVSALGQSFGFNYGDNIARLYDTPQQLRILNSTIKHIKPVDKSYKKLKQERGVNYTIKSLNLEEKKKIAQLRSDYQEYHKRAEEVTNITRVPRNTETLRQFINRNIIATNYEALVSV